MTGLDTLVTGLFDYAGLFPPAALPLQDALREAAKAPRLRRPRMVGADFVVPLAQLDLVTRHELSFAGFGDTMCTLAVVGVDRKDLAAAVRRVKSFNRKAAPWAQVVSLEAHAAAFPPQALASLRAAQRALAPARLYLEPKWTPARWKTGQAALLGLLQRLGAGSHGLPAVGMKVRCAGPTAVSRTTLQALLPALAASAVPLKATQGLHHALPTGREQGFLNLAMAFRLLQVHGAGFPSQGLAELLRETDAKAFSFDDGADWRGFGMHVDTLEGAMSRLPFTIGSCSLEEPDQELSRLFG
ncbi:MAG TPA: hypothetical protein VM286_09050 [Candidatus Thermoplasmatota archaeon]|nr:hypothetical protein [Candidatus Thermoplasmatota archaeon]